jgi:YHS domain-containing protein
MKKTLINTLVTTMVAFALIGLNSGCSKSDDGAGGTDSAVAYPLDVCAVSGEKLGSMGEPIRIVHQGQEVKFCCKDCVKEFEANPEEFMLKIMTAEAPEAAPVTPEVPAAPAVPEAK